MTTTTTTAAEERISSLEELAELLGISTSTLRRVRRAGGLDEITRRIPGTVRPYWLRGDVDAWLRRQPTGRFASKRDADG